MKSLLEISSEERQQILEMYSSETKVINEQSNVYTDKKKYDYAMKIYNTLWYYYNGQIKNFNKTKSFKYKDGYNFSNIERIIGLDSPTPEMANLIKNNKIASKVMDSMIEKGGRQLIIFCKKNNVWETKTEPYNSNISSEQQADKSCPGSSKRFVTTLLLLGKPNLKKPILKPIVPKPTPEKVSQTSTPPPSQPNKVTPPTPQSNNLIQTFNYMSTDDKKRAIAKYGSPDQVPFQGVRISDLRREFPNI